MALPNEKPLAIRLYVTHVDGEDHFLKISGQLDQQASLMLESLFLSARDKLEKGIGAVSPGAIYEGVICAAKYKDGTYYRAQVINTSNIASGLVGVHFIDYGNRDIISLSTIRFLNNYDPVFLQLRGQANDYYLSRLIHPSGRWEDVVLQKLQGLLCYSDYPATIDSNSPVPLISITFKSMDLAQHLASIRFGIAITMAQQEALLRNESQQVSKWQPNLVKDQQPFSEHVPFLLNQNFPLNPAAAMRLQQNASAPLPFNGNMPATNSLVSHRLLVNKVSRNTVNLKAPARQLQAATHSHSTLTPPAPSPGLLMKAPLAVATSPKKSSTYKSRLLETNSLHQVFVSYAEEGPELFAVQVATDCNKLQEMMEEINKRPHSSLAEPPMIGTVCLGRMSGDRIICRAIVMNLSGSQCKLFFVDFGDTEMVSYYDIFDIPEEFVKPNVFAMRFCLSGVKKLEKGPHLNETFKQLVSGKLLTLRVVPPEGPPLIQYGELFIDKKNVLDLLLANIKDKVQFKWMEMLPLGTKQSVLVSYVDSCVKFFIQLSDKIDELTAVMDAVKIHCENSTSPGELPIGAACCAQFPDDGNWYRARVQEIKGNKIVVAYVDYGNEQEVEVSDLRTITPDLVKLPAQALKCALKGFENRPVESKTSNQLEMLALEKTLMASIVGVLSSDTMLVTLVDDTVTPPLDVARRMNQLSQPRSSHDAKATTPIRKDAPETFSSPEESQSEDGRRRSFRREKSFKEDRPSRPPREDNPDFLQRGGSFRNRDNFESFDRSGTGRHSEKFAGRSDRGDRNERNERRGPKPWETNQTSPPQNEASEDGWEESTSQPSYQPQRGGFNRDSNFRERDSHRERDNNRDRRKPRSEDKPGPRPNWKKDGGAGKRLRQAAEESSADTQNVPVQRGSIQDRLKRDRFEEREERKNDDWGNRNRENRPPRENRDRGERREWGEKKEGWGEKKDWGQKREFRDNRGDRSERPERSDRPPRSNFSPRDRAEKSFGSEKSFKSQDSGRSGRAPPFKPRSKFTQVQYKELPDPISLDTPFADQDVELGAQHEVSVTWIISPESFYTQILSLQPKFLEMMHQIPELYKGVKPFTGDVPVGATVLARYPADGVLYRATVVAVQPFSKFIVRYVDFGNKQLVDVRDIWQLDRSLLELPKMAIHCSLIGVAPNDGEWKSDSEIDLCFNAPRYQCVFQESAEDVYKVSLWNNGVSVADTLVEKQLAKQSEHQSSVTLKDEPIDMTIIVGQQIMCRVTHVESFDKFYIQLDIEKAALVEETIANYDVAKLAPPSEEIFVDGTHCTLKHDGKIYRAILQDVSDTANIQAVLPDYGNTITTSVDNLMILPSELSVYYYQSLNCCLNNYTEDSTKLMSLDELKARLTGNKFIVYINEVDGITLVTTLYDSATGQKVAIFEPDEGAYDEVVTLCMRSVFNYNFGMAYLSHAENLNEIYLQKSTDGDRLAVLLEELYKFYEEGTPEPLTTFEVDEVCVAKSSDSNWYRATIVSVEDTQVKVQFTDYGNSESVPKESLKKLDAQFFEPCALALVASLGLVALQENALATLMEWATEKEIQVTLSFGNDGWLANLHLDGLDLSMKLINEKLATPQVATVDEEKQAEEQAAPIEEPVSLPSGCTQVYISHIDTPGHFWLQMLDKVEKIDEIQAELQANADSYPNIENREMGTLCIAKYLADEQWYRAEILDADADITTVRFVDYGNTDVLDNQPGLIKTIPDNLKEIERYGVRASVNAVPTGTGEWTEAASESFTQLVGDLSAPVDALIVLKDVTTYVDIFVGGQNITDKLVTEGHAARSEEAECGDLPSCFASHVNSPSEFWIQLESAAAELQVMEEAMVDAENFPELKDKEEGVICAAKYPEDGAWYRAQVIVDGSEGTEVLFMDYGNASITNELRSLPDELKVKPALSRKCALQKPRDIKTWSRRSEVKFNELAAEGATIFNVQFIASGDISIVELYLEGKSVTEELVELCEEQVSIAERPTPVGQDLQCSGKICYVQSVHEFYVNLESTAVDLEKVAEALYNAAEFESVAELKVGTVCAAFWSEDCQWYRARILEFCDTGYHVLFIDCGNKAKCEEFRQLPEEFAVMEPLAKSCRLVGVPEDSVLQDNGRAKLDELALEDVTLKIEILDSSKEPMLVKIVVDDKDVLTFISAEKQVTEEALSETTDVRDVQKDIAEVKIDSVTPEQTEEVINAQETVLETVKTEDKPDNIVVEQQSVADSDTNKDETVVKVVVKDELATETGIKTEIASEKESVADTAAINKDLRDDHDKDEFVDSEELNTSDLEKESIAETAALNKDLPDNHEKDEFVDSEELNTSNELNESLESNHTVIENKSFEADADSLSEGNVATEDPHNETPTSPGKNVSSETLENSSDTIKTPEREESKESITDTGYTSDDKSFEKDSPKKTETLAETEARSDNTEPASAEITELETVETKETLQIPMSPMKKTAKSKEELSAKAANTEMSTKNITAKEDLNKTI